MKKIIYSFWATATAFGLVGACGGDSSDPGGTSTNNNTTSPTTTTTAPNTATTTPTSTTSPTTTTTTTGTSTTGSVPACTTLGDDVPGLGAEVAQIPASQGVYAYGDMATTACVESPAVQQVCLFGEGAVAGEDFANWGAGVGILLATTEPSEVGWNATADGVVAVKFSITGTSSNVPVRAGITVVGLTDYGYTDNPDGITTDAEYTINFADLVQPPWAEATVTDPFDPTNIHSLQFQVVTAQSVRPYHFCVSNITWLDANGMPVDIPYGTGGGGEGGAGGEGGGAGAAP